jgi:hypothetical protein
MVIIKFSDEAEEMMDFLRKEAVASKKERMILQGILQKIKVLELNVKYGNQIKKNMIPEFYKKKYLTNNLFRVELPLFWRMLYTLRLENREIEIIAFVLDVVDHKEYNKKFRYKKR